MIHELHKFWSKFFSMPTEVRYGGNFVQICGQKPGEGSELSKTSQLGRLMSREGGSDRGPGRERYILGKFQVHLKAPVPLFDN